jgi:CheY-like chemotaxis protein
VLIVEDHPDAREVLHKMLEYGGFDVATATNGQEALAQIQTGLRPCLILLDVMMPVMDGPTFAERLRASEDAGVAKTPIVILTGAFDSEAAARRAQALEVIRKPVSFQRINDIVHRHCRPFE